MGLWQWERSKKNKRKWDNGTRAEEKREVRKGERSEIEGKGVKRKKKKEWTGSREDGCRMNGVYWDDRDKRQGIERRE